MAEEISRKALFVLTALVVLVSVVGTLIVMNSSAPQAKEQSKDTGIVMFTIEEAPVQQPLPQATGNVAFTVLK